MKTSDLMSCNGGGFPAYAVGMALGLGAGFLIGVAVVGLIIYIMK